MEDPTLFGRRAEAYERGRPAYPPALYERLRELRILRPGLAVLDVGAGSGQATEVFVAAGAQVTAVEPSAELAGRLVARWPQVAVQVATFEDAQLPASAFDVAVCATAFHWLDTATALPSLHRALRPDGTLAVWWNIFGNPEVSTPFRDVVTAIASRRNNPPRSRPDLLDTDAWLSVLTANGHFESSWTEQFAWSITLTAQQVSDLFSTFTGWTAGDVAEATTAVHELGGTIEEHYLTALYVCRAASRSCAGTRGGEQ